MGLHCTDCVYSSFSANEGSGLFQGACSRGFTLADPRSGEGPGRRFAAQPRDLVPVCDSFGKEYLRKSCVCERFSPRDASGSAQPRG